MFQVPMLTHTAGPFVLHLDARQVKGPRGVVEVTPLEGRFLGYLLAHRGRVVTTEELLQQVWGYHPSVSSNAAPLLVSRLRRKLGEDSEDHLVRTALGGGYVMPEPAPLAPAPGVVAQNAAPRPAPRAPAPRPAAPPALRLGSRELDLDRAVVREGTRSTRLTRLEVGFLRLLLERKGRPVPVSDALRQVWGYRAGVETRAVTLLVRRLRQKIEVNPEEPRFLLSSYGTGYRLATNDVDALVRNVQALVAQIDGPTPVPAFAAMRRLVPEILVALDGADVEEEARLRLGLAALDEYDATNPSFARIEELADTIEDPELALRCRVAALRIATKTGATPAMFQVVPLEQPTATLRQLALELRLLQIRIGPPPPAAEVYALVRLAKSLGNPVLEAFLLDFYATVLQSTRPEEAILAFEEALRRIGPHARFRAPIVNNLAVLHYQRGDVARAAPLYREAAEAFDAHGLPTRAARVYSNIASVLLATGDERGARANLALALDRARLGGDPMGNGLSHLVGVRIAMVYEDLSAVEQALRPALFVSAQSGERHVELTVLRAAGWLDGMTGRGPARSLEAAAALDAIDPRGAAFARLQAALAAGEPVHAHVHALSALGVDLERPETPAPWRVDAVTTRRLADRAGRTLTDYSRNNQAPPGSAGLRM